MNTLVEVMDYLKNHADPSQLSGMAHFGMTTQSRLGISIPVLRSLAKKIGKNTPLALQLWDTGFAEAQIVAGMVADPKVITAEQVEEWVKDLDSWDVCDQLCMNLLEKVPFAIEKVYQWAEREEEYVKRAAFALIACIAWHDKKSPDDFFTQFFPIIEKASDDNRNFVRKAVSWALRHIGKHNLVLNAQAITIAERIGQQDSKAARWISTDVLRELQDAKIQAKLKGKV